MPVLAQTMPPIELPIDLASVGVAIAAVGGVMLLIWAGLYIGFTVSKKLIRRLSAVTDGSEPSRSATSGAPLNWTGSGPGRRVPARNLWWGTAWSDHSGEAERASSIPTRNRRR